MVETLVRVVFKAPQVWIALDTVGAELEFEHEDRRVKLRLPADAETFSSLPDDSMHAPVPSLAQSGPVMSEPDWDSRTAALVLFEVTVEMDTDVPDEKPSEMTDDLRAVIEPELEKGIAIAEKVAGAFLRHVRAAAPSQSWLGLATHAPVQYGLAKLEYKSTGQMIFGLGPMQTVTIRSSRLRLGRSDFESIGMHLCAGDEPQVAESLLADAWHLDEGTTTNDHDRAIIVAAMACEVKTKRSIRGAVPEDRRALVEMILKRRSNLPELLDEVSLASCDVTMRLKDPQLFSHVKALSAQRNAIVHSGRKNPSSPEVAIPARIAWQVFKWLDENLTKHELVPNRDSSKCE